MILIGKKIKELRNKYKLTQTELATRLGVTKSTVAAYENDSRQPSYEVLVKMADVFKVTIDSLLLDRSEVILDGHGLNVQQVEILQILIAYFRKSNYVESFLVEYGSQEIREKISEFLDVRLDEK